MNKNFGKDFGELEIADLIEESVANAAQRRQQFAEDSLIDITEEEARNIEGGLKSPILVFPDPTTLGIIIKDPCTTVGLIATDPPLFKSF